MPYISTLITNYNHGRYLEQAVESALAQTQTSHEVIIVDDGSTDDSRARIDALAARHPHRLIPLYQENKGQAAALNAAFAASNGEAVFLLDSDDYWHAQKTAAVLPRLESHGFVQHNLKRGDGLYRTFLIMSEHLRYMQTIGWVDFFVPTSGLCFRREVLDEIFPLPDPPQLRICTDAYITRLALQFTTLATIDAPLGVYRVHDANHWYLQKHRHPSRLLGILALCNAFLEKRGLARIPFERNWQLYGPEAQEATASLEALRGLQAEDDQALPATVLEGTLHLAMQRFPEALRAFESALAMDAAHASQPRGATVPEDVRLLMRLVDGETDLPPPGLAPRDTADAHYNRAVCHVRLGQYEQALEAFAAVLRHAPERLEIHLNRSDSLRYLGRYELALAETDLVEAKDPAFPGLDETRRKVFKAMAAADVTLPQRADLQRRLDDEAPGINIQIQTTSRCNGKCIICPYLDSWHKNHPGEMTDTVFERVLAELSGQKLNKICVYFENEPLMDPKIFQRMARIRQILPFRHMEISTNAALLSADRAQNLAEVLDGLDHAIWISFHGVDSRTYKGVMGLDFDRSLANVRHLLRLADRKGLHVTIRAGGQPRDSGLAHDFMFTEQQFRDFWNAQFEALGLESKPKLSFFHYHDRCGTIRRNAIRLRNVPRPDLTGFRCPRIDGWLHFLYTGELSICCMDYHREHVFGDIRTSSLKDILRSEAFRSLRDQAYGLAASPPDFICKRCISPNG